MRRSELRICQRDGLSVDTEAGQLLTTLNILQIVSLKINFFYFFAC